MPIRAPDVQWFSELVLRLHASSTDRKLFQNLLPAVHVRFGSIISQAEESSWDLSIYCEHGMYGGLRPPPDYVPAIADHPLIVRLFSSRRFETMHRASLVSWGEFGRTNFYNVLFRPWGLKDQLLASMNAGPGRVACFGVNRDTEFKPGDHVLLEHVRRHAEACLLRIRRTAHPAVMLAAPEIHLGRDLTPFALTPTMRERLRGYFPADAPRLFTGSLPEPLERWVRAALAMLSARPPPAPLTYFRTEGPRGQLWVRLFPDQPHGHTLRLTEELRVSGVLALRDQGMTLRECEVLHWLMAGKRDGEIAVILGTAPRTVEQHVANLRRKLGAGSRLEATQTAHAWLRAATG